MTLRSLPLDPTGEVGFHSVPSGLEFGVAFRSLELRDVPRRGCVCAPLGTAPISDLTNVIRQKTASRTFVHFVFRKKGQVT